MNELNWQPFTRDYDYDKEFYDVLLPDGTIVKHCWPNAGMMCAIAPQRQWTTDDGIQVRLSPDSPLFEEREIKGQKVLIVDDVPCDNAQLGRIVGEHLAREKAADNVYVLKEAAPVLSVSDLKPDRPRRGFRPGGSALSVAAMAAGAMAGVGWDFPFYRDGHEPYQSKEPSPELDSIKKKMSAADAAILEKIRIKREEKEARRKLARGAAYKPCYPVQ